MFANGSGHAQIQPRTTHTSPELLFSATQNEGCEDVQLKEHAITEFLPAEEIPSVDIHRRMQTVCREMC
jgi:hypothetical protein